MKVKNKGFVVGVFVFVILVLFMGIYVSKEGYYNSKTMYSDFKTAEQAGNLNACKSVFQCVAKCKYLKNGKNACLMKCYNMKENKENKCIENVNAGTVNANSTSTDNPCQPLYDCISNCKNSVPSHSSQFGYDYSNSGVNCVDNCMNNKFYSLNKKYRCV